MIFKVGDKVAFCVDVSEKSQSFYKQTKDAVGVVVRVSKGIIRVGWLSGMTGVPIKRSFVYPDYELKVLGEFDYVGTDVYGGGFSDYRSWYKAYLTEHFGEHDGRG